MTSITLQDYVSDAIMLTAMALDECLTDYNNSLNHCIHDLSKYVEEQNAVGQTVRNVDMEYTRLVFVAIAPLLSQLPKMMQ